MTKKTNGWKTTAIISLIILALITLSYFIPNEEIPEKESHLNISMAEIKTVYGIALNEGHNLSLEARRGYLLGYLDSTKISRRSIDGGFPYNPQYYLIISITPLNGSYLDRSTNLIKYYKTSADIPIGDDCVTPNECFIKYK